MNRQFSDYTTEIGKANLSLLADKATDSTTYSQALYELGRELGRVLAEQVNDKQKSVCVACSAEDADYLATGVIESLTDASLEVSLACFWNQRQRQHGLSMAPIVRKYREPNVDNAKILIMVKSVISGTYVVKTNLTHLIETLQPDNIFVVAPVIHKEAPHKLSQEFSQSITNKFHYVYFATDTEKQANGDLIPGVGSHVYQRLGFKDQADKNKFTPKLVKNRSALLMTGVTR
jgi:hypothetical protein